MNKKILLLLFLTTLACSSKPEKPIPEKQLEGWAGNPDNPNEKPFDYYYMRSTGRASLKAIERKSGGMIEATCIYTVNYNPKSNLIRKMIRETIFSSNPTSGQLYTPSPSNDLHTFNYSPASEFYFQTKSNSFNTLNLIAMTDGSLSSILVEEYERKIKDAKVKYCKPLAIPDSEIPFSEWKECECTVYAHIPGGKDTIIARTKELDRE